jgi:hypothetical protein
MTASDLKHLHDHRPFKPFTIKMSDGQVLDIVTPEYMAIHPRGRMAFVWRDEPEGHSFIALDAITSVNHYDDPFGMGSEGAAKIAAHRRSASTPLGQFKPPELPGEPGAGK